MTKNIKYYFTRYILAAVQFLLVSVVWAYLFRFIANNMPTQTTKEWFFIFGITLGIIPIMAALQLTIIVSISVVIILIIGKFSISSNTYEFFLQGKYFLVADVLMFLFCFLLLLLRCISYKGNGNNWLVRLCGRISGESEQPGWLFKTGRYSKSYDQEWEKNSILILEIDDIGQLYTWTDISATIKKIKDVEGEVCLITFVHGWNHNASLRRSGNLQSFIQYIANLQIKFTNSKKNKRVIGIFIAWQGQRYIQPLQRFMTFFDRSEKSREIGGGDIKSIYSKINSSFREKNNIKIFHVGHSFGASVLYTALSSSIIETFTSQTKICQNYAIVMLNPAFEGKYYLPLYNIIKNQDYRLKLRCYNKIYILTSEKDDALNGLFIIFKFVRIFTDAFRNDLQRRCLNTPVGNIDEFSTVGPCYENLQFTEYRKNARYAILVKKVKKEIIKDHNDIWNGKLDNYIIKYSQ